MWPWQRINSSDLDKSHMKRGGLLNVSVKNSNKTAETVNFHFSHYKSMGTKLQYQPEFLSDRNKKNISCVEANVINM